MAVSCVPKIASALAMTLLFVTTGSDFQLLDRVGLVTQYPGTWIVFLVQLLASLAYTVLLIIGLSAVSGMSNWRAIVAYSIAWVPLVALIVSGTILLAKFVL